MKATAMAFVGLAKVLNKLDAVKPEIMLGAGVVGVVGATVLACKATLKAGNILDEHTREMDDIHEVATSEKTTEEEKAMVPQLTTNQYVRTTVAFVKAYAPAVIIGAASIALICGSHVVMKQRNIALTAALSSANAAFSEYRGRVANEIGSDEEYRIFNGGKKVIEEIEEIDDNGKKHKKKQEVVRYDKPIGKFCFLFDEHNRYWQKSASANKTFVECQQRSLQATLNRKQRLTVNEILDAFGEGPLQMWDPIKEEMVDDPEGYTRGFRVRRDYIPVIDFDLDSQRMADFMDGYERSAWITINVDEKPIYEA